MVFGFFFRERETERELVMNFSIDWCVRQFSGRGGGRVKVFPIRNVKKGEEEQPRALNCLPLMPTTATATTLSAKKPY